MFNSANETNKDTYLRQDSLVSTNLVYVTAWYLLLMYYLIRHVMALCKYLVAVTKSY